MPRLPAYEPALPTGNGNGNGAALPRVSSILNDRLTQDPALKAVGMPPNYGNFDLPHIMTFQGLINTISRTYVISDEALNDSFANARFMEYDVGIRECLDARMRSSVLLDWHIEPEDDTDPLQVEICGKLTKIVKSIEEWQQIQEQWAWAIWWGRSAVQFKFGWEQVAGEWYVKPVHWLPIHGDKLVFRLMDGDLDHAQHQMGIRVGQTYKAGNYIDSRGKSYATNPYGKSSNDIKGMAWQIEPTDRGLAYFLSPNEQKLVYVHKHQIQDGAYERPQDAGRIHGVGIRSVVYWEWFQEKNTLQWLMEFIERSAFGLELWYYPLGNEKARADTETAIKERVGPYKRAIAVPVPPDDGPGKQYGVDHIETGAQGADILLNIIEKYFGWRRKRYILGQILTTEAEATGLGGNLASIHLLSFRDIIKADSKSRDNVSTKFVNMLKQWNFPGNAHWKARYVTETDPVDADERLNALKSAQDLGADITKKSIYKAAGITPPGPDDEIALPAGVPPELGGPPMPGAPPNTNGNAPPVVETQPEPVKYADGEGHVVPASSSVHYPPVHPNLVEYAVRDLFKGRKLENVAKSVAKKFHGSNNMFLGGDVSVTHQQLKHHLLNHIAKNAMENAKRVKPNMGHFALSGTASQFNIPERQLAEHIAKHPDYDHSESNGLLNEHPDLHPISHAPDKGTAQYSEPKDPAHAARRQIQFHEDMLESGNLTKKEKAHHTAEIGRLTPHSKSVDLREHIRKLEPQADKGALVGTHELHQSSGLPKPEFDKRFLEQHRAGEINGHRHDYVSSLSDEQRGKMVHDPEGHPFGGSILKGSHYLAASIGPEHRAKYSQEFEALRPRGQPDNAGRFAECTDA